jgi:hypothetical protein
MEAVMKIVAAAVIGSVLMLWAGIASAQDYSALDEGAYYGPYIGVGGLMMTGDNGLGDNDSEFIPTVNLSGVTDYLAYQLFYGFGSDSSVLGGSLDYVIANNFDECSTCPDMGMWWFGAGVTAMDVTDLYAGTDTNAGIDDTLFGGNLGFGYMWDRWAFNIYAHLMTESQIGLQAAILYDVTK